MAEADYVLTTGKQALTANATKSLWLLNPVTISTSIIQIDISMDGSTTANSVEFDLYIVTALGSPTGTTGVFNKVQAANSVTAQTSAFTNLTAEPTTVSVLASWFISPFSGLYTIQFPLGREPSLAGAGARWGLRYITPASVSPNCISNVWIAE